MRLKPKVIRYCVSIGDVFFIIQASNLIKLSQSKFFSDVNHFLFSLNFH